MDALVARLDLANAQTGEVVAVGRQELVDGGWNLELDDRVIAQLERDGSSCAPDQLPRQDVVLIEFAGAVPLVLVASVPPMFIGLDEDADALRCWPLRELPRRQSVDERPPPDVSVSRNWHPDSSTPASVALDLLPERAGTESLKLALAGDTLSLSLSAADGELLLTWSSDAHCE